jgi:hypothetical protein
MQNIKNVSIELSNKIEEMINSKVENETYLSISKKINAFDTEVLDYVNNMNEAQNEDRFLGNI